jgi:hypothetical protein
LARGVYPYDILLIDVGRKGKLDEDAVNRRISIETLHVPQQLILLYALPAATSHRTLHSDVVETLYATVHHLTATNTWHTAISQPYRAMLSDGGTTTNNHHHHDLLFLAFWPFHADFSWPLSVQTAWRCIHFASFFSPIPRWRA